MEEFGTEVNVPNRIKCLLLDIHEGQDGNLVAADVPLETFYNSQKLVIHVNSGSKLAWSCRRKLY